MHVYVVPHGSEADDKRIELLARRLKYDKVVIDRIYATSHPASESAAHVLSRHLRSPLVRDDRLPAHDFYDRESESILLQFIQEIVSRGKDVLLMVPPGMGQEMLGHLLSLPPEQTRFFMLDPIGVSCVSYIAPQGWCLALLNDTHHLRIP